MQEPNLERRANSKPEELRARTKSFALRIIRLFQHLPRSPEAQVLGKQLLHSGTAVGANYHAAGRARSRAEFTSKIAIVVEEVDETVFWLECLIESGIVKKELLHDLLHEANELLAQFSPLPIAHVKDDPMARSPDHPILDSQRVKSHSYRLTPFPSGCYSRSVPIGIRVRSFGRWKVHPPGWAQHQP